jgi:hypothetical protein
LTDRAQHTHLVPAAGIEVQLRPTTGGFVGAEPATVGRYFQFFTFCCFNTQIRQGSGGTVVVFCQHGDDVLPFFEQLGHIGRGQLSPVVRTGRQLVVDKDLAPIVRCGSYLGFFDVSFQLEHFAQCDRLIAGRIAHPDPFGGVL